MSHVPRLRLVPFVLVPALIAVTAGAAAAQEAAKPLPPRLGWEAGFGVYGGEINCHNENGDFCDGVTEAGGIDLHVNYMFRPKLGVVLDIWPMVHTENDWTFTHNIVTFGVKYRPVPILWLQAGVGSAQARLTYSRIVAIQAETDVVPAIMVAAGLEVLRSKRFALDIQARAGTGFYEEDNNMNGKPDVVGRNLGVGVGLTWF